MLIVNEWTKLQDQRYEWKTLHIFKLLTIL